MIRVLIWLHDFEQAELLKALLEKEGHSAVVLRDFSNLEIFEAVGKKRKKPFKVIITEANFAFIHGGPLAAIHRAQWAINPPLPIIAICRCLVTAAMAKKAGCIGVVIIEDQLQFLPTTIINTIKAIS